MNTEKTKNAATETETTCNQTNPQYNISEAYQTQLADIALSYFMASDDQSTPAIDQQKTAFITGCLIALHKTRTYSPILFANSAEVGRQIYLQLKSHRDLGDIRKAYEQFTALTDGKALESSDTKLTDLLVTGYRAGLHISGKYDDVLFLEGPLLKASVLASIISFRNKLDNARRAESRITINRYGVAPTTSSSGEHHDIDGISRSADNIDRLRQVAEHGSIPVTITPVLTQPDTSHLRRAIALEAAKLGSTQPDDTNRFYRIDGTPASPEEIQKMCEEFEAVVNSAAALIPKSTHEAKTCRTFTMIDNDGRPLRIFVEKSIADYLDQLMKDAHNQPLPTDDIV